MRSSGSILGKNGCSVVGLELPGRSFCAAGSARDGASRFAAEAAGMRRRDGGLLRRPSSRPRLRAQGHDVRLMSPEYVRPYVKAQKNDERDAEGIAEAATRPTMRFVELKSEEQLDMQIAASGRGPSGRLSARL